MTVVHTQDRRAPAGFPEVAGSGHAAQDWWKGACIYQIYPRSFKDANGDGEGDLRGVIGKLDYLLELGVDAIWLSPFYPSPMADGGYDVSDYCDVDGRFGTLEDFDDLLTQAHDRGIRVVIDIVPNHTSNQHPWFRRALEAAPGSPERERYVFAKGKGPEGCEPPTNWLSNFGGSAWEPCSDGWYYLHLFAKEQPDLNWDAPQVRADFLRILKFWCDRGVDGFRIDVSHGLAKDLREPLRDRIDPSLMAPESDDGSDPLWDRDQVHAIYREWRRLFDSYDPPKYAIGETWTPFNPRVYRYSQQDELGAVFDFSLLKCPWDAKAYARIIDRTLRNAAASASSPTWVLSNHDVPRHASRLGLPCDADVEQWVTSNGTEPRIDGLKALRRARAATLMLLGLPGTVFLYQGEELGLPEDLELTIDEIQDPNWERSGHRFKGRDGCRIPIPWRSTGGSFGFSDSGHSWLTQPEYFAASSVERESAEAGSTLQMYRVALRLRALWNTDNPTLTYEPLDAPEPVGHDEGGVAAGSLHALHWRLPSGLYVIVNFSDSISLPLPSDARVLISSDAQWEPGASVESVAPDTTIWYLREAFAG